MPPTSGSSHDTIEQLRPTRRPTWRRILVTLLGALLVVGGAALLVLPGPGTVLIVGGLTLLGTEYAAARRVQRRMLSRVRRASSRLSGGDVPRRPPSESARPGGGIEPPL